MENKIKNLIDEEHLLVKSFFKNYSIVESNLTSFNNFIENKIIEIAKEAAQEFTKENEFEVIFKRVYVKKPFITESDGSTKQITPFEARLRNLTYSAPVYAEVSVKYKDFIETEEIRLGKIPIMVKSKVCNLYGLSKEELIKMHEDPLDKGGYFLINGHERVLMMFEDLASNQPFIEKDKRGDSVMLRFFSQRGAYKIPTTIVENKEGIIEVSFSRFKKIPLVLLLKALGIVKEQEIAEMIGVTNDSLIVNLNEFPSIASQEEAILKLAEMASLQGTKEEIKERIKQRIDFYLLPHLGTTKNARKNKGLNLCKLTKQFYLSKELLNDGITDKDHYANKRIKLSGDLLADLFRANLNIFLREIQHSFQKTIKRKKDYSISSFAKSTLFSDRIESAIATGSWVGEKTGVTQNMKKDNFFAIISQLQKVVSSLSGEQENFAARALHPTHYGRFCPIETPEGTEIGLRKNLAMLARISTECSLSEEKIIPVLKEIGLSSENFDFDVFFNGNFIGSVKDIDDFFKKVKNKRREGKLPYDLGIRKLEKIKSIFVSTEPGRIMRPLIVVENGQPRLKEEHLELIKNNVLTWNDLIKEGVIEFIDAGEEDSALVALYKEDLTPEHDYLEIDPIAMLGTITSFVPYANHDQSARLLRGTKTQTQSCGIYFSNFNLRLDTDVSVLIYPQKPLARSFTYDCIESYPAGQNVVVAVMPYEGYNIQDAVVLNKGSVDRGLGRIIYYKPYSSVELNYAGRLKDDFCIPDKSVSKYRSEDSYKYLEEDGIIYPEAEVKEGDVLIGKVSPPKFLSDLREISMHTKKDNSTVIKQEEEGTVDMVFVTQDSEGNKLAQIRIRDTRKPEVGDKFATPHGQKGVIGLIVEEESVPFSVNGIKPDIIFNPHGIPSRMTAGYLLEVLASKVAALSGRIVDTTAFCGTELGTLEENLKKLGFRYDGKEIMYNPITGERMPVKIFVGTMYYLRLKHMVKNKLHARASGKIALLTRQPIEGRAKGGGLRLGEMEQQALVGHGASLLLKERYDSDKVIIHICEKCGALALDDQIRKKKICPICQSNKIEPVEVSYAFKLLVEELEGMNILTKFELKNKYER